MLLLLGLLFLSPLGTSLLSSPSELQVSIDIPNLPINCLSKSNALKECIVAAGSELKFSVKAEMKGAGNLTLLVENCPRHAEFEVQTDATTVTGDFTFKPKFNQVSKDKNSPIKVTFIAKLKHNRNELEVRLTVDIFVIKIDLDIYDLKNTVLADTDDGGGDNKEEQVGSLTCVNIDNDDKNNQFDSNQGSLKLGVDDELVKIRLQVKPTGLSFPAKVRSLIKKGSDKVRIWVREKAGEDKLTKLTPSGKVVKEVELSKLLQAQDLWVDGIKASSAQRDIEFELILVRVKDEKEHILDQDKVTLTVIGIKEVTFIGQNNSVHLKDNPATPADERNILDRDPHPSAPGAALRVFPGARTPGLGGTTQDKVKVKVVLSTAVPSDLTVYLKSFDVDDPSANTAPVDAEIADEDNRGNIGGKESGQLAGEDADGIATLTFKKDDNQKEIEFQITMQPGDNFRVVASCDTNGKSLKQLRNKDRDDGLDIVDENIVTTPKTPIPESNRRVSPVLTVWRFLHVEVDSMTAPPAAGAQANSLDRVIASITGNGTVAQRIFTTTNIPVLQDTTGDGIPDTNEGSATLPLPGGSGRFENGSVRVGPAPGTTTRGLDGNGVNFIQRNAGITIPFTVSNPPQPNATGNVIALAGAVFTLRVTGGPLSLVHNGGTINVAGVPMAITGVNLGASTVTVGARANISVRLHDDDDDTALPRDPLTGLMSASDNVAQNLFAAAYIRPVYDGGGNAGNNTWTVPFVLNTESATVYRWGSRGNNSNRFWVVYILAAWQDSCDQMRCDRDPNSEGVTGGSTAGIGGALIYIEQIRERGPTAAGPAAWTARQRREALEKRIVVHEVGHAMRIDDHGDNFDNLAVNGVMN